MEAYYRRGHAKIELGRYDAAITDFDTAIELKPDYVEAYYNRGILKYVLNRTWEAKQDWQTALRLATEAGDIKLKNEIQKTMREFK